MKVMTVGNLSLGNLSTKGKQRILIGAIICLFIVTLFGCGGATPMTVPLPAKVASRNDAALLRERGKQ